MIGRLDSNLEVMNATQFRDSVKKTVKLLNLKDSLLAQVKPNVRTTIINTRLSIFQIGSEHFFCRRNFEFPVGSIRSGTGSGTGRNLRRS